MGQNLSLFCMAVFIDSKMWFSGRADICCPCTVDHYSHLLLPRRRRCWFHLVDCAQRNLQHVCAVTRLALYADLQQCLHWSSSPNAYKTLETPEHAQATYIGGPGSLLWNGPIAVEVLVINHPPPVVRPLHKCAACPNGWKWKDTETKPSGLLNWNLRLLLFVTFSLFPFPLHAALCHSHMYCRLVLLLKPRLCWPVCGCKVEYAESVCYIQICLHLTPQVWFWKWVCSFLLQCVRKKKHCLNY